MTTFWHLRPVNFQKQGLILTRLPKTKPHITWGSPFWGWLKCRSNSWSVWEMVLIFCLPFSFFPSSCWVVVILFCKSDSISPMSFCLRWCFTCTRRLSSLLERDQIFHTKSTLIWSHCLWLPNERRIAVWTCLHLVTASAVIFDPQWLKTWLNKATGTLQGQPH